MNKISGKYDDIILSIIFSYLDSEFVIVMRSFFLCGVVVLVISDSGYFIEVCDVFSINKVDWKCDFGILIY